MIPEQYDPDRSMPSVTEKHVVAGNGGLGSILSTAANLALNEFNNSRNLAQYYRMRAYNTPSAQMGRFRMAGMNPHLAYTQSNEVTAPPQTTASDVTGLQNISKELSDYQNIAESRSRVDNLEKQNQLLNEQIYGQVLQNDLSRIGLKWSDWEHYLQTSQGKQALLNAQNTYDLITEQINQVSRETKFKDFEEFKGWFDMWLNSEQLKVTFGQLDLDWKKFREQVRQFNEVNFLKDWFDKFIKGFSGDNPQQAAESLGIFIRSLINAQIDSESSGLPLLDEVRNYFRNIENKRHGGSF